MVYAYDEYPMYDHSWGCIAGHEMYWIAEILT